ncbi:MAG: hypothetical protein HDS39_04280 [Bacteroides sp.]|nr:hypothetical protein [Bacteroides sp.]
MRTATRLSEGSSSHTERINQSSGIFLGAYARRTASCQQRCILGEKRRYMPEAEPFLSLI